MVQRSTLSLVVALALIGCEGANPRMSNAQARTLPPAKPIGPVPAQTIDASRRTAITTAVERVAPSVVTVQTETVQKVPVDFFEYFMGGRTGERRNAGIGSGFVVRSDGIIVTNAHVIAGATKVSIGMRDGTSYEATVVGIDETNDLAVVRIKAKDLPSRADGKQPGVLHDDRRVGSGHLLRIEGPVGIGHVINMRPQRLAGLFIPAMHTLLRLGILQLSVDEIDTTLRHNRTGQAVAYRHPPTHRQSLLRKGLHDAGFVPNCIAIRSAKLRPVIGSRHHGRENDKP